jgi:hypothetical protein
MSFEEKIENGYYEGKDLSRPEKPERVKMPSSPTAEQLKAFIPLQERYEENMEIYKGQSLVYRESLNNRRLEFQTDLEEETGVTNYPKEVKEKLISLMNEYGDGESLQYKVSVYEDFVELVNKANPELKNEVKKLIF